MPPLILPSSDGSAHALEIESAIDAIGSARREDAVMIAVVHRPVLSDRIPIVKEVIDVGKKLPTIGFYPKTNVDNFRI